MPHVAYAEVRQSARSSDLVLLALGGTDRDLPVIEAQLQETLLLPGQPGAPCYKRAALTRKWKPHMRRGDFQDWAQNQLGVSPSLETQGAASEGTNPETAGDPGRERRPGSELT